MEDIKETKKCRSCSKIVEVDKIKRLGRRFYCLECIEYFNKNFKAKSSYKVKIETINLSNRTYYNAGNSTINLLREDEKSIIKNLNHEVLHYTIHKLEGYLACHSFDNIAYPAYYKKDYLLAFGVEVEKEE